MNEIQTNRPIGEMTKAVRTGGSAPKSLKISMKRGKIKNVVEKPITSIIIKANRNPIQNGFDFIISVFTIN